MKKCKAIIELMNGESVTPCHKERGHEGQHEGYCLGSRAVWTGGRYTNEEYQMQQATRIKKTRRVKRGLAAMRELLLAGFDSNMPPSDTIVKTWKKSKQRDFNAAMDWIEQEVASLEVE